MCVYVCLSVCVCIMVIFKYFHFDSDDDIMEEWEREETRDKDWVEHTSVRYWYM